MTSFKITVQRLLLAGLVAGGAATAMAQSAQPASPAQANAPAAAQERHGPHGRGAHHHGDRQAAMAKRQAELKQQLQITAAQEPAWNLFTAAMLPDGRHAMRQEREAMNALTTPQRIERMRALRAQRDAAMERRADATLKLYAALSAEQQKVFDARSARHHGHGHHGGPRGAHAAPHNG
jgi:protein CpxP